MKQEECEGCWSYGSVNIVCLSMPSNGGRNHIDQIYGCPCGECLVKTMCDIGCFLFKSFKGAIEV